jgi:hypothetical protein
MVCRRTFLFAPSHSVKIRAIHSHTCFISTFAAIRAFSAVLQRHGTHRSLEEASEVLSKQLHSNCSNDRKMATIVAGMDINLKAQHHRAGDRLKRQLYHMLLVSMRSRNGKLLTRTIEFLSLFAVVFIAVSYLHSYAAHIQTHPTPPTSFPVTPHKPFTKVFTSHPAMSVIAHQPFTWQHPPAFTFSQPSAQSHSLTSGVPYSPVGLPLKTEVLSPLNYLAPSYHGSHVYSYDSSVLGGLGMASGSQAQWSTAASDSNSSRSPLERLGFKLHLTSGGEKKTRGQATHVTSLVISDQA